VTTPSEQTVEREQGKATTPEAFAKDMGWGAKRVRQLAKKLGACRILGNRMALMPDDIKTILEATKPCPSSYSSEEPSQARISGTTGGPLMEIDYEARLAQRTAKQRRSLSPRPSAATAKVFTMERKER
jgi:hypothetical protein